MPDLYKEKVKTGEINCVHKIGTGEMIFALIG